MHLSFPTLVIASLRRTISRSIVSGNMKYAQHAHIMPVKASPLAEA